jgi:4-hydroxy-4-methyl-2-oxoglutarate aldolase
VAEQLTRTAGSAGRATDGNAADGDLAAVAAELGTATLHEAAGQIGAMNSASGSRTPGLPLAGWAFPVACPANDNLWLHRGVYAASPGDVLVVDVAGHFEAGYWGEVLSWAARSRGLAGVVIDGGVRDVARLGEIGVPVFSRCRSIRGTTKHVDGRGQLNEPTVVGGLIVPPGDLVVGDDDGVVLLPRAEVPAILAKARARQDRETEIIAQIREGRTTLELFGFAAAGGAVT